MTLRIAYNLFTQKPKQEKEDFARWIKMTGPGKGDDYLRCNGAGEMLVFSAADFEDFLEPRPDLARVARRRTEGSRVAARREQVAVPPARDLRRKHHALPRTCSRR